MEIKVEKICYKCFCCDGDLDHYFFYWCPNIYEFCAKYIYREVQEQTEEELADSTKL
jgi:hypothetical protein